MKRIELNAHATIDMLTKLIYNCNISEKHLLFILTKLATVNKL